MVMGNTQINSKDSKVVQYGDIIQLISVGHKHFILTLGIGEEFQTHRGIIYHDQIAGLPWGSEITSHNGKIFKKCHPCSALSG